MFCSSKTTNKAAKALRHSPNNSHSSSSSSLYSSPWYTKANTRKVTNRATIQAICGLAQEGAVAVQKADIQTTTHTPIERSDNSNSRSSNTRRIANKSKICGNPWPSCSTSSPTALYDNTFALMLRHETMSCLTTCIFVFEAQRQYTY